MNLHLYLPSASAHPPGSYKGLIIGTLRRYWLQNTKTTNYRELVTLFASRLIHRGYNIKTISTSFLEASDYLRSKYGDRKVFVQLSTRRKRANRIDNNSNENNNTIYYHTQYHPRGIKRRKIQQIYGKTIARTGLYKRKIVAFSRSKNLRDLLSPLTLPTVDRNNPSNLLIVEDNENA